MVAVVGIDEVGRGCWAGPLVAGAVILRNAIDGLKDSKKLTKNQREKLDVIIRREALSFGLGWVTPAEIDARGLTWAVSAAMARALTEIDAEYGKVIIDGNYNYLSEKPPNSLCASSDLAQNRKTQPVNVVKSSSVLAPSWHRWEIETMVHGDDLVPAVSAASIIAKVARDNYMIDLSEAYVGYGFENHVGYGTKQHVLALKELGSSGVHRHSFTPIKAALTND